LLESIAEGDAVEDLFVELSSLFVAEAVVVGREVVGCISALAMSRGSGRGKITVLQCDRAIEVSKEDDLRICVERFRKRHYKREVRRLQKRKV
jgi:hypothetical protein